MAALRSVGVPLVRRGVRFGFRVGGRRPFAALYANRCPSPLPVDTHLVTIDTCTRELTLTGSKEIRVSSRGVQLSTRWLARTLAKLLGSKRAKAIDLVKQRAYVAGRRLPQSRLFLTVPPEQTDSVLFRDWVPFVTTTAGRSMRSVAAGPSPAMGRAGDGLRTRSRSPRSPTREG
jgi:hypothetical protein